MLLFVKSRLRTEMAERPTYQAHEARIPCVFKRRATP